MRKIPPMNIETFFRQVKLRIPADRFEHLSLTVSPQNESDGGGWRANADHGVSYGDTVSEAIRAAFDHVTRYKPRRARLNPPYFTSDREAKNWDAARRVSYDYRATDWQPPKDDK